MNTGFKIIDSLRGTSILKFYDHLQVQSNDIEQLKKNQIDNLVRFLIAIRNNNRHYQPLLKEFSISQINANPIEVLNSLEPINKRIINAHLADIFTPFQGVPYQQKKTGGSTGAPFYYNVDKQHLSWMWAYNYYFWNINSGYQPGDLFVTIAGTSLRTVNKKIIEQFYYSLQNNYFIKSDLIKSDLKLDLKKLNKAKLIYGYPSSIQQILKVKPDFPEYFKNLRAIFTTSEQLLPNVRGLIEKSFGKPVYDIYGANDGGILGCECRHHNGYHFNFQHCIVQTLQNEHNFRELLLTNLNSYNFPFIRYQVGDIGNTDYTPCTCGSNWPRIVDLKGRTRDLIKTPEGKAIHGAFFNTLFYRYPSIEGYRIVQEADYTTNVFILVSDQSQFDDLSAKITQILTSEIPELKIDVKRLEEKNPTNSKFKLIESHVN